MKRANLKTIKVTEPTIAALNYIAGKKNEKQYESTERIALAEKAAIEKISEKIRKQKNAKSNKF